MIICANIDRISSLLVGKGGLQVTLNRIEAAKEDVMEIKKRIKNNYIQMLHLHVALIESIKRKTWDGLPNHHEFIQQINEDCKKLNLSIDEMKYVFEHKVAWVEKDKLQ